MASKVTDDDDMREKTAAMLVRMKAAENLENAYTLVDAGEAQNLIKTFRLKLLDSMLEMYRDGGVKIDEDLGTEFDTIRKEVEEGKMSMTKYAVPNELANQLLLFGVCKTEEEAMQKVASGEAPLLLKKVQLEALTRMDSTLGGVSEDLVKLSQEIADLESSNSNAEG